MSPGDLDKIKNMIGNGVDPNLCDCIFFLNSFVLPALVHAYLFRDPDLYPRRR
jgi:hypothetical protein